MYAFCFLCSFLVLFSLLTSIDASTVMLAEELTAKAQVNEPQTHILSLLKSNRKRKSKDFELDEDIKNLAYVTNSDLQEMLKGKLLTEEIKPSFQKRIHNPHFKTDDLLDNKRNTLENTNDEFSRLRNETNSGFYLRFKQSIPVLEPVRHLLNTVREGGFNHTTHFNKTRHQLIKNGTNHNVESSSVSSAIETEAERDMVLHGSESTNFQLLDFLGSIGGMMWQFLMNIKKWFAASGGGASAAFSGGSF